MATVRQDYLKPADVERVRTGEFVKTYHVGRSAPNQSTMHEAHRVYRLEKPSRWNLARNQPPLASTGPVNKIVDSAFRPAPESKAIRAELNRQKVVSSELERARDDLADAVVRSRKSIDWSEGDVPFLHAMREEMARLNRENARLKASFAEEAPPDTPDEESSRDALKAWGEQLESDAP